MNGTTDESMRMLVPDPTIQYIIINLLTKYDYSSLHGFTAIFDEKFQYSKYGKTENWTNAGNNIQNMERKKIEQI